MLRHHPFLQANANEELPQWLLGRSTWNDELVFLDHRTDGKRSSLANNPRQQQLAGFWRFCRQFSGPVTHFGFRLGFGVPHRQSTVTRFSKRRHTGRSQTRCSNCQPRSRLPEPQKNWHSVNYVTVLFQRLAGQWVKFKNRMTQVEIPPCAILGDRCCVMSEPRSQ